MAEVNTSMKSTRVTFSSHGLTLEGVAYSPTSSVAVPGVVVCHPHPLYGGSMDNNVVDAVCEALAQREMAALKFNFRGVGGSEGSFDHGAGEMADVTAAVEFVANLTGVDGSRIGLAGYSAGSAWGAMAACEDRQLKTIVAISPPLEMFNFRCLESCTKPKFILTGSNDQFIPVEPFIRFCEHLPAPCRYRVYEGADHSWQGYEEEMAGEVAEFLIQVFTNRGESLIMNG